MRMKKIRLLFLTLVALLGTVNAAASKTVYIQPGNWANDNAVISLNVWGDGENTWADLTEVETGIFKATVGDGKTTMAVVRAKQGYGNTWKNDDQTNVWNQTGDITFTDGKLYKLYDYDNNMDGIYVGHGVVEEDYTEPVSAGYTVDFDTTIATSNHNFAVASNWKHIVGSNNYDNSGPYYMSYSYSATGGVGGSGTLSVGAQNGYYMGNTQSEADFTDGSYDYLVTPKVNGAITLQVKRYAVTGYASYVKIFAVDAAGTTVGDEIEATLSGDISESDWVTLSLTLTEEQRLAIRAQSVLLDNFTAESATIELLPALTISSVTRADGESTTYFDMNADGSYTVSYKVKIQNTGEVALVAGTTENYTLSVSIDGTAYGSFDIPVDVAVGETSEEFVATIVVPNGAPTGWKYRTLKENLSSTTFDTSNITWSNTLEYNPVPYLIKKGNEPVGKGRSLDSETAVSFGMISEATTLNYEVFANNAGDLLVKSITATGDFTVAPAETLPYTIAAHTGMYVDITANATATDEGTLTITYVDKNGADQTVTATLSQIVFDESKWIATFDGGTWPEGTIHQSSLSFYTSSYYGCDNAIKSSSSYNNKFFTPLLHAAAGESMTFDAMLDYNYGKVTVYVTTDRNNLGEAVLTLNSSQLNTSKMTSQSITIDEEGDYYVVFEIYAAMADNFYGFEKVDVAHDIMVNSFILNGLYAGDKTVQTGDVLAPKFEVLPVQSETADAYSVKLYANNEVVATIAAEDLTDLTAGTAKTFTFSYTPEVTATTTLETYAAIEFTDETVVKSATYNLTVTCEPVFHFVKELPANTNEPDNYTTAINFGRVSTEESKTFYIYNWGKAPLQVTGISLPEGFTTSLEASAETPLVVAASTGVALDIVFTGVAGSYGGNLAITYIDKDGAEQTFEIAVSGIKLDPTLWFADFGTQNDNSGLPAGSLVQSNVSCTTPVTGDAALGSYYSTNNLFITPLLNITEGDKMSFDTRMRYSTAGTVKVYLIEDHIAAAEATTDEDFEALTPTLVQEFEVSESEFTAKEITLPSTGNYYLGFKIYNVYVDNLYGLKLADVAHEWQLVDANIPTEAMQNVSKAATVLLRNFGLQEETEYSVIAYVNGEATTTEGTTAIPMVHTLTADATVVPVAFKSPKAGTYPVYFEIKAGDYSVATDPVEVVFAEEEAKSEADMATNGTTYEVPLYLNYKNSESVTMYNADALASAGISAGAKIKKITYKGYKTTDEQTTSFQVYYKWTDDQTLTQPTTTYPYEAESNGMTKLIDENHTWAKVGSSNELGEMIVLDFTDSPLTYEAGKSLVIYMHSYVDGYKTAYFEKSTLSSDYCYTRKADAATLSSSFSKATPAAVHFTLEASVATLAGTVKNSAGAGIEGATITLKADNGVEYSGTTAADGSYSFNVIQAGLDFTATVEAEGFLKRQFDYSLGGESKTLDVTMYTKFGIVGTLPGINSWNDDLVLTQSADDPNIFTAELNNVAVEAGDYTYKLRADGAWNSDLTGEGYELPSSGNYSWNFSVSGNYNFKFTFDWTNHELTFERPYTLAENNTAEIAALNWVDVTVEREFKAGWNAVVLPFGLNNDEFVPAFGENSEVAVYDGDVSDAAGNVTVKFKKQSTEYKWIEAGMPVLIYLEAPVSGLKFTKDISSTLTPSEGTTFDFVGTYTSVTAAAGDYFIAGGKFVKATTDNTVLPFRAYLKLKCAEARSLNFEIVDGNESTAISAVEISGLEIEGAYNLSGQKVQTLNRKGLYIINGKKVMVK